MLPGWMGMAHHTNRGSQEDVGHAHPTRLGVIAAIDCPGSPAGEAISAFFGQLFGRTPEQRRAFRQRVLQVTLNDLKRVAATYLEPERASLAVVSDPETLSRQDGLEVIVL